MGAAKALRVAPVERCFADAAIERWHYSGRTYPKSRLHLGVWLGDKLCGAMQFGPPIQTSRALLLVRDTPWNGFVELNRMAFSEELPRNSESRALSVALRLLRSHAPHVQWVLSYADATQCGDGAIYRASGFVLTQIKRNSSLWRTPRGAVVSTVGLRTSPSLRRSLGVDITDLTASLRRRDCKVLDGFMLRYVFFLDPAARARLTVPEIPFSAITEARAHMIRGTCVRSSASSGTPTAAGGATPTLTLQRDGDL